VRARAERRLKQVDEGDRGRALEVLRTALRLGVTSFGGPLAHLGYFERVYVRERGWLTAEHYATLVALCQILPGPTSSQVGFLVGLQRGGWPGALAAWIGFTLPSALLLYAAARLAARVQGPLALALVHGLKLVAVAVVAQAVWTMAQRLCTDVTTRLIALAAAALLLLSGGAAVQLAVLAAAAVAGLLWCRASPPATAPPPPLGQRPASLALALFGLLLLGLPLAAWRWPHSGVALAEVFYRAGALVFGGGHVVLPLLRAALVPAGWLSDDSFLTGYGLAQAVPGPLFTVAAYLGAVAIPDATATGAAIAVLFIFLPGLLLAVAGAVLWSRLAQQRAARAATSGVNAAVVGILAAALYQPVWVGAVRGRVDVVIAAAAFALLQGLRAPPLAAVVLCVAYSLLHAAL
jgi:chromate transporter